MPFRACLTLDDTPPEAYAKKTPKGAGSPSSQTTASGTPSPKMGWRSPTGGPLKSPKLAPMPPLPEQCMTPLGAPKSPFFFPGSPSRRLLRSNSGLSILSVMSSKSWYEDSVAVEDVSKPDKAVLAADTYKETPVIIADVKPHVKETLGDPALVALLEQVQDLSHDCFHDNCLQSCSKRGGWRITLLASRLEEGAGAVLLAFIVFKLRVDQEVLSIAKLAVPEDHRRRGYGRDMIMWAVEFSRARKEKDIACISLSSLPASVKFYQRLNFKYIFEITSKHAQDDEELVEGQVYMELSIRKRGGRKGGGGGGGKNSSRKGGGGGGGRRAR